MIGTILSWSREFDFGVIGVDGPLYFPFVGSGVRTRILPQDEVDFWLDENPQQPDQWIAVDIEARGGSPPRLFVGNLPADITPAALREALEKSVGPLNHLVSDPRWNYAFADFTLRDDAIRALDGTAQVVIDKRALRFKASRNLIHEWNRIRSSDGLPKLVTR